MGVLDLFNFMKCSHTSYSQCGEDLIVDFVLENRFKINKPIYLDIGAHDPFYLSNTYKFYKKGGHGVLIEPDPFLFKKIKRNRRKDLCLNLGIGIVDNTNCDFYIMDSRSLNTFSKLEAERYQADNMHKINNVISVPIMTINQVVEENFITYPNFISLDVEGLDLDILKSFDFERFRPEVFCVETLTYTNDFSGVKIGEIFEFMDSQDYFVYADTYINSIFIDKRAWNWKLA